MSTKSKTTEKAPTAERQRALQPDDKRPNQFEMGVHPAIALQRVKALPASALSAGDILALQRTVGNRAVQRLLSAPPAAPLVQRQPEAGADEEIQTKRSANGEGFEASSELESQLRATRGSGSPLPETLRARMEHHFGTSFANVRVHHGEQADRLNQSLQARAFTTGDDLYFKRGEYYPESREGQKLIAHELTHVMHQQGGGNTGDKTGTGSGTNLTVQRAWYNPLSWNWSKVNPRNWCGKASTGNATCEEAKPQERRSSPAPEMKTEQPASAAAAPTTDSKVTDTKADGDLIELRNRLPKWVASNANISNDLAALRFLEEHRKDIEGELPEEREKHRNKRLRELTFDKLKEMKKAADKKKKKRQKAEESREALAAKQRAEDQKKIAANRTSMEDKVKGSGTELKAEAEELRLEWGRKWDDLLAERRGHLDDNWYKSADGQTMNEKASDIKKYVSRKIAEAEAGTLVEKQKEKGLGARNQYALKEKAKNGLTLTQFRDDAKTAIKRQGKLSKDIWKDELKFSEFKVDGPEPLNKLGDFETHLRADDASFRDPVYDDVDRQTPDMIMDKLLKVPEDWKQIHVSVDTGHRDSQNRIKNPHLFWFGRWGLKDEDGNLRYSAPLDEKSVKDHLTKELDKVQKKTVDRIKETIDRRDTTP
jgi:Domain of unknown function (DUF4157)